MKRRMGLALLGVLITVGCVATTGPEPRELSGYFAEGFEVEAFHPCGLDEQWWVANPAELSARYREAGRAPYEKLFVVVRGELSPAGSYGHLGHYRRELAVSEVVRVDTQRQGDCD